MFEFIYAALARLQSEEEGQTMIEYALVIALIVLVIAGVLNVTGVGNAINGVFTDVINEF